MIVVKIALAYVLFWIVVALITYVRDLLEMAREMEARDRREHPVLFEWWEKNKGGRSWHG